MYYCCGITEKGIMDHNEDAIVVANEVLDSGTTEQKLSAPFIAAVSDGVSGERSGEIASKMCLEMLRDIHYSGNINLEASLRDIHRRLAQYSADNPETHNMQATLCGIAFNENGSIVTFNVGDSRLYRYRGGFVNQISRDQSLVQLLYEEGTITMEQRRTHVHRNIIFPAFGNITTEPQIDIVPLYGGMEYGDLLLLCSDGLSDYLSPLDIEEILEMPKPLPERLKMLVDKALENKGKDNISIVAVVYSE